MGQRPANVLEVDENIVRIEQTTNALHGFDNWKYGNREKERRKINMNLKNIFKVKEISMQSRKPIPKRINAIEHNASNGNRSMSPSFFLLHFSLRLLFFFSSPEYAFLAFISFT